MVWFYLSILSITALACGELLQQNLLNAKRAFNERTSAVVTYVLESLLTVPVVLFSSLRNQIFSIFEPNVFPKVLLVTGISAIATIFYFRSFRVKNISFSTIFISGSAVISTILGIIFFHESVNPIKFIAIFLILTAIFLVNFKNISLERNHLFGLVAGICFGITYTLDKGIVGTINPLIYVMWAFFFVAVWTFLFNPKTVINSLKQSRFSMFIPVFLSAVAYCLYNILTFFSYRFGGEVGKVDAINNSQIFLIILFEFFILGHKQSMIKKIVTALIAFIGVAMLGFLS